MFDTARSNFDHLTYVCEAAERADPFAVRMLTNRLPEGILPLRESASSDLLSFSVKDCVPLSLVLQKEPPGRVFQLLAEILEIISSLPAYLLTPEQVVRNIHFVFFHVPDGKVRLLYLPTDRAGVLSESVRDFLRSASSLALHSNPPDSGMKELLIFLYLLNDPSVSEQELINQVTYLASLEFSGGAAEEEAPPAPAEVPETAEVQEPEETPLMAEAPVTEAVPEHPKRAPFKQRLGNFLRGTKENTAEKEAYQPPASASTSDGEEHPYEDILTNRKTGEVYALTGLSFVIGSDPQLAEICVKNNPYVEREHCRVFRSHGECYIEDLNSKAGTWVNGAKLNHFEEESLKSADFIEVGGEEFVFANRLKVQ